MKQQRPHLYFKVSADTPTGRRLQDFVGRCARAQEEARQWAEAQGASEYLESPDGMAGGVGAVAFSEGDKAKGWESVKAADGTVWYLPEPDSDLERGMYALPVVSEAELIAVLSLRSRMSKSGKPMPFTFGDETPLVFRHHGFWYADIPYESEASECELIGEKEFFRRRFAAVNESAQGGL